MSSAWTVGGVGATAIQCAMWGGAGEALFPADRVPGPPPNPAPSPAFSLSELCSCLWEGQAAPESSQADGSLSYFFQNTHKKCHHLLR